MLGKIPHLTGDQRGAKKRRVFSPEEEMRLVARYVTMSNESISYTNRFLLMYHQLLITLLVCPKSTLLNHIILGQKRCQTEEHC